MKSIIIEGQLRSETGRKATRQLRSEGQTPGVIYGGPKEVTFSAAETAFKDLVYTPNFQTAEVKIGDKTYHCVLKDLQFHPVTDQLLHIDFVELVEDKEVTVSLPIKFVGQAKGVILSGGRLRTRLKTLKIKSLPKNLKSHIEIDVSDLELDQNIRVEDLKEDAFKILNSPRVPIVSVTATRAAKLGTPAAGDQATAEAAPAESK